MKRFGFSSIALLSVLVLSAGPASAQSSLTFNNTLVAGGVTYNYFTVTTAGMFDIWTTSGTGPSGETPFDPVLFLFGGFGTGGAFLGSNDDGCGAFLAQCGDAVPFDNAILNNIVLGVGSYTAAVGGFSLTETEARSGINDGNPYAGDFILRVASLEEFGAEPLGVATGDGVVPEPATMTLLATGLAGMAAARRKKRNA